MAGSIDVPRALVGGFHRVVAPRSRAATMQRIFSHKQNCQASAGSWHNKGRTRDARQCWWRERRSWPMDMAREGPSDRSGHGGERSCCLTGMSSSDAKWIRFLAEDSLALLLQRLVGQETTDQSFCGAWLEGRHLVSRVVDGREREAFGVAAVLSDIPNPAGRDWRSAALDNGRHGCNPRAPVADNRET